MNTLSITTAIADSSVSQPVAQAERIQTIDMLRGVALLGILLMNIPGFAMPDKFDDAFRSNPSTVNFWVNAFITIVFEGKMRALFSMIFGVGIILFMTRKEKGQQRTEPGRDRPSAAALFYRRMGWLVLFGLLDAHVLLWFGDILYFYGVIGMLAFLFRKMKPGYLAIGVPLVAILGFVLSTFFYQNVRDKRMTYLAVETVQKKGKN